MKTMAEGRERDLVLAPNEYAYILDETKGHVIAYVGPHKTSMANTDRPVVYDPEQRRYRRCGLEEATTTFPFAEEGWYIVLENPAKPGDEEHPGGGPNSLPKLSAGRKINIPGPATFPLWPGQVAGVLEGHHLRSNQYLVVQVYNEEAARENWARAVIKPQKPSPADSAISAAPAGPSTPLSAAVSVRTDAEAPDLTTGNLLVVRGTEVSFYIPPTGIEVVADGRGRYVRDAVTLERLEYCILLDEDGNKRFIQGPAVVFPRPTETFVERTCGRKFRAIELNELSGLYVKVIAPYTDEQGSARHVGEELFITGRDQMIYFPRPEHAIIKYGDQEIHYAVAIPAGEARYVLDRLTGAIGLKRGPCMFLPDPRKEVIVRRVLDPKTVDLMFPDNPEAQDYNRRLQQLCRRQGPAEILTDRDVSEALRARPAEGARRATPAVNLKEESGIAGEDFTRQPGHTPPRSITLDTKYEGAVTIDVWTGYAVLVVARSGQRRVVAGPATSLLDYDETLEALTLSSGTPKSSDAPIRTVYLRVLNNKVSDVIEAETRDLCSVAIRVSYRVSFEGDPARWFDVEDYVKFLTDHMRSLVRHAVKRMGIEEFHANSVAVVRDAVLGQSAEAAKRPGRHFEENGMAVTDVEVLDVRIGDETISGFLVQAQHTAVHQAIQIAQDQRNLEVTRKGEEIKQLIASSQSDTACRRLELKTVELRKQYEACLAELESQLRSEQTRLEAELARQETLASINTGELTRERARLELELSTARSRLEQRLQELQAEADSLVRKASAITPEFIAALQSYADKDLAGKMAETMAPLAILGGRSVADVLGQLLKGTSLEAALAAAVPAVRL